MFFKIKFLLKMIKIKFLLIFLFPIIAFSQNQVFNGKLTYMKVPSEISVDPDTILLTNQILLFKRQRIERELLIKDSMFLEKRSFQNSIKRLFHLRGAERRLFFVLH